MANKMVADGGDSFLDSQHEISLAKSVLHRSADALPALGKALAARWHALAAQEQIVILKEMLRRIVLSKGEMRIVVSRRGLLSVLHPDTARHPASTEGEDTYEIRLPATLKRCGIETKLIVGLRGRSFRPSTQPPGNAQGTGDGAGLERRPPLRRGQIGGISRGASRRPTGTSPQCYSWLPSHRTSCRPSSKVGYRRP